ncbi:MAG: hypothetical protein ACJ790_15550 [Myxococcaceae bacterium]
MNVVRALALGAVAACLLWGCSKVQAKEGNSTRGQDTSSGVENQRNTEGAAGATPWQGGGTVVKDDSPWSNTGTGGSGSADAGHPKKKKK